jgi:hypothetical protein
LVELTGLRGSRFGVPNFERSRKSGRSLPGGGGSTLFGSKPKRKRKTTKKRKRASAKRSKSGVGKARRPARVGRKKLGRKHKKKGVSRPKMLYGLRGAEAAIASDTIQADIAKSSRKKQIPVLGAYQNLFTTQRGWASMAGAVTGYQVANVMAAGMVKASNAIMGEGKGFTAGGFLPNVLSDLLTAGLLYEAGNQFNAQNFGAFAAVVAATRSLQTYVAHYATTPLMDALKLQTAGVNPAAGFAFNGLGAWQEYGYEGGGVGLYRESDSAPLGLYREAEDAPLGVVRVPDGTMLGLGNEGAMFEQGSDDGTLFG